MTELEVSLSELRRPAAAPAGTSNIVRPVSQVGLYIDCGGRQGLFDQVQSLILRWLDQRAGRPLPDAAWRGDSFELEEIGSQRLAAIKLPPPRSYWSARLDDADKQVPLRTWVTEIGLSQVSAESVFAGARLVCVTRGDDKPYERSTPVFVRQAVEAFGAFFDGRSIGASPTMVSTEADVEGFVSLINSPLRQFDVIVCSLPEGSTDPADAVLSPLGLHRRTLGAAHVFVLSGPASYYLTDRIGKEFSVLGAVRTYRPSFDLWQDEPFRHPLCLPDRITGWHGGVQGFETFLVSQALARSISLGAEQDFRPFLAIRQSAAQAQLEIERDAGTADQEMLTLAFAEIEKLRQSVEEQRAEYDGLLAEADRERDEALEEAKQSSERAYRLRQRNESLQKKLEASSDVPLEVAIPVDLDSLPEWCEEYLAGAVELHNRAFRGAKTSAYDDPPLVYRALLLLRDYYVPMRRAGGAEAMESYNAACARLGVKLEETFAGPRWGEEGDTYKVLYNGTRHLLDLHLTRGNSRDPRYCFRLYFFWDDVTEQVVVGWLPSHLETCAS